MKSKIISFILILLLILTFGCSKKINLSNDDKGISLQYNDNYVADETDNYIKLKSEKNKLEIIITLTDIYEDIDADYKNTLDISKLDIQCGAFDTTYNNYDYAGNLFAYLLDGNSDSLLPVWCDKTTIGTEDCFAYYSALEGPNNCGYIYETVQNGKLYIIMIYIDDYYDAIFDYSKEIDELLSSICFN